MFVVFMKCTYVNPFGVVLFWCEFVHCICVQKSIEALMRDMSVTGGQEVIDIHI